MTNSDFNRILRTYDTKQAKNKQIQKQRQEAVFAQLPQLKELHKQISSIGLKSIRLAMQNPMNKDIYEHELIDGLRSLKAKKEALLQAHGYPADYLEAIYDCQECQDTGYVDNQKCFCLKQAIIDFSYEQSNLKSILSKENFQSFSFDYYSKKMDPKLGLSPYDNMVSVHSLCLDFVADFDKDFKNLILYGHSGLGKTFLCNSIAKEILDSGHTVIYLSAFQLFRLFENYRFHKEEEIVSNDDIESIFLCDLLIIDDLGTEFNNALTKAELFNCLNTRLLNKKPTVISTNLAPGEWVNQYSERIISRIFGYYTQLKFIGSDIRMTKYR
jgi:DNA replication protein DnaC